MVKKNIPTKIIENRSKRMWKSFREFDKNDPYSYTRFLNNHIDLDLDFNL